MGEETQPEQRVTFDYQLSEWVQRIGTLLFVLLFLYLLTLL